jgi:hypothetical protein
MMSATRSGDDDGHNARHHDALEKSPKDQLRKRRGCGRKQRGKRNAQERCHNDGFA